MKMFNRIFGRKSQPDKFSSDNHVQSSPAEEHVIGLSQVKELKERKDVDGLIAVLSDEDKDVRRVASYNLGKIRDKKAVDGLIATLSDEDTSVRYAVVVALGEIGDKRAVEGLVAALSDKDMEVRRVAAGALEEIGDERAVEGLIAALKDENSYEDTDGTKAAKAATWALGKIGGEMAGGGLIAALNHKIADVRSTAAYHLEEIGDKRAVEGLVTALSDKDMDVRRAVAEALAKIPDEMAIEGLIAALSDKDMDVRRAAAEALGKIGNERAIDALIMALKDTADYPVVKEPLVIHCTPIDAKVEAAIALGKIGGETVITALKSVDNNSEVQGSYKGLSVGEAVAKALGELGAGDQEVDKEDSSDEPGKSAEKSSEEQNSLENNIAVEHELRVGDIVDIDSLVLGQCVVERIETNPDGRGDIAFIRAENAVSPLEYECEHGDPTLYQFRSTFLGDKIKRFGKEQGENGASASSHSESLSSAQARPVIARIAEKLHSKSLFWNSDGDVLSLQRDKQTYVPILAHLAEDSDPLIRQVAVICLGRFNCYPGVTIPTLVRHLGDEDRDVSYAADMYLNIENYQRSHPSITIDESCQEAITSLENLILDRHGEDVENGAWGVLSRIGRPAVPTMIRLLKSSEEEDRSNAVDALSKIGEKACTAIPDLVTALHDSNKLIRNNAAEVLGSLGPNALAAVPNLIDLLDDDEGIVTEYQENEMMPPVWVCVKHAALAALQAITGERENEFDKKWWQKWSQEHS